MYTVLKLGGGGGDDSSFVYFERKHSRGGAERRPNPKQAENQLDAGLALRNNEIELGT